MKCPKCHTENYDRAAVCKSCGSPLSDAVYTTLDSGTSRKAKRKKWPLITLLLIILLACGGFLGYRYYIYRVEKECLTFTNELFKGFKSFDLTGIEEKYHPEQMPVDPDLKGVIKDKIKEVFESSPISSVVDIDSLNIDYDILFDELAKDANYKIVGSKCTWNQCTVRVTTSNADFSQLPQLILDKAQKEVSSLFDSDSLAGILSDLFKKYLGGGSEDDSSQSGNDSEGSSDSSSDTVSGFTDTLVSWYREVKEETPRKVKTADIVFKFKDGKWTLDSFDKDLVYSFYGVPSDILDK